MSCGAKFYDLARDPAVCPKCGTVYQPVAMSRVSAPAMARSAPAPAPAVDDDDDTDEKGPELVSLDEVEAAEADVADLIDGDIENDEES